MGPALGKIYGAGAFVPGPIGKTFDSGFADSALSYNALSTASDGKVYYALSSEKSDIGAQMFRYDPLTAAITHLADLTEACGEKNLNAVVQGKVHTNFHELNGKLYFSTHLGFYSSSGAREVEGTPPAGVKPYPGGHFLAYDLATGAFKDYGIPVAGEGIIAVALDKKRELFYGLTWPSGILVQLNLQTGAIVNYGPTSAGGEKADPPDYRALTRSMEVDPPTGDVYLAVSDGSIVTLSGGQLTTLSTASLKKDILGFYDINQPSELGWGWRQTVFHESKRLLVGVHGRTSYLILFDLAAQRLKLVHRVASQPTNSSGQYDCAHHGYLSFKLGPDGETIYYLTGAHIDDASTSAGIENMHLVTYNIVSGEYIDRGPVVLDTGESPNGVNSIAIGDDETIYSFSKFTSPAGKRFDLFCFKPAAPPPGTKLILLS